MTESVFVFKVALKYQKGIWRKIAIRGDQSLTTLHHIIYRAFNRDEEHLYAFYFSGKASSTSRSRLNGAICYGPPNSGEHKNADSTRIDGLRLKIKSRFEYLFDFGDEWWHEISLEELQPLQSDVKYPCVIESRGKSPAQYPDEEDEDRDDN